jgi:hypothetical protein
MFRQSVVPAHVVNLDANLKLFGTGLGQLEFGTTRRACSRSELAVPSSEASTSGSSTPNRSCGIGSGELEFEKTVLLAVAT